jgi:hypothetical protein
MDADDWGEFADNPAPSALYTKGSDILYQTREGVWVPGKVSYLLPLSDSTDRCSKNLINVFLS